MSPLARILTVSTLSCPAFVLLIAFVLGFWQWYRKWRFCREIEQINRELTSLNPSADTLSISEFKVLTALVTKLPRFQANWTKYKETTIEDDASGLVFCSINLSKFIKSEDIIDRGFGSFHAKSAAIVTSFGLLFTFCYIVYGLLELRFTQAEMQASIQALVSNLAGKFISSIVGVFGAICLTVSEHNFHAACKEKLESLLTKVDGLLKRRTEASYLSELRLSLVRELSGQTEVLKEALLEVTEAVRNVDERTGELKAVMSNFGTDLSDKLKNTFEDKVGRPVMDALGALQKEKSENLVEILQEALGQFKSALSESTDSEFATLGVTVTEMAKVLRESSQQSAEVAGQIDRLLVSVAQQSEKSKEASDSQLAKLQAAVVGLVEDLTKRMGDVTEVSAQNLAGQTDVVHAQIGRLATTIGHITEAVEKVTTQLNDAHQTTAVRLGNVTSAISESTEKMTERQGSIARDMVELSSALKQVCQQYTATMAEQEKVLDGHRHIAKQHIDAQEKLQQTLTQAIAATTHASSRDVEFRQMQEQNLGILAKSKEVFSGVESGLEKILSQLARNIELYNQATTSGLSTALNTYGSALEKVTGRLQSSVDGVSEVLESIDEMFASVKRKVG